MSDAEIVAEFCAALKAHVDAALEVETNLTKQTVANLFAAQKRVKVLSEDALGAALGELDRLTAELAKLRAACEDVPWMLERAADLYAFEIADVGIDDNSEIRSWREQSQYLRAALESEADHE